MEELTDRQREVLEFIVEYREENVAPPTLEEIRDHFSWSAIGTVQDHIRALVRKGYLRRSSSARSLEVLRDPGRAGSAAEEIWHPTRRERQRAGSRSLLVPVLGDVAAGRPILAVENVEESWLLDRKLLKGADNFLLRVRGESMSGAGIGDGDYVLVRPQPTAESGEIVVALLDDEVTVKRFFPRRDGIELRPENPAYRPIIRQRNREDIAILGKVVGVMRRY